MTLRDWLPTAEQVAHDLTYVPALPTDLGAWTAPWQGYELHFYSLERTRWFNGFAWSRASELAPAARRRRLLRVDDSPAAAHRAQGERQGLCAVLELWLGALLAVRIYRVRAGALPRTV